MPDKEANTEKTQLIEEKHNSDSYLKAVAVSQLCVQNVTLLSLF